MDELERQINDAIESDQAIARDTLRELAKDTAESGEVRLAAAEALLRSDSSWIDDVAAGVAEFDQRIAAIEEQLGQKRGLRRLVPRAASATR